MKKSLLLAGIIFFVQANLFSQDSTIQVIKNEILRTVPRTVPDSIKQTWIKGGLLNLNVAQGSLKDWAAGGDNFSLALTLYTNAHLFYKKDKVSWDNNLDYNLGYINTTSAGTRKNDDRFDLISKYGYALNKSVDLSALFDLRTQFFDGFTYASASTKTFSSTSLAPGYITLSPGFDFKTAKNLSLFLSPITSRLVVVLNPTLSRIGSYGVDSGKHVLDQLGAFGSITYHTNFNKIVSYNGRLDLFSDYQHNPQNVDVYFTNLFAAKVGKVITATWGVDMIYDDDVRLFGVNHNSPRLQLRSLVGLGILLKRGI